MKTLSDLLSHCRHCGVTVASDGRGGLRYGGPAWALGPSVVAGLAAHKPALLRLLAGAGCPECGGPLSEKSQCWECHNRRCVGCGRPTGSAFIANCIACGNKLPDDRPWR